MCRDDVKVFAFRNPAGFPSQTLLAPPRPMSITLVSYG
jgi:hypothetical protein